VAAQAGPAAKVLAADYVIWNDGPRSRFEAETREVWEALEHEAAPRTE